MKRRINIKLQVISIITAATMLFSSISPVAGAALSTYVQPLTLMEENGKNQLKNVYSKDFEGEELFFTPQVTNGKYSTLEMTEEQKHSGEKSLKVVREETTYKYKLMNKLASPVGNAKISLWIYVKDATEDGVYTYSMMEVTGSDALSKNNQMYFGVKYDSETKGYVYSYRAKADADKVDFANGTIEKEVTPGWHHFSIDFTKTGTVIYTVDGDETTQAVVSTGETIETTAAQIWLLDIWGYQEKEKIAREVYVDDLTIEQVAAENEDVNIPTGPITYDTLNLFGFTPVEDFAEFNNYEYSVDGGSSYKECTANPQFVGNENYAPGQVCVRLKQPQPDIAQYEPLTNDVAFTKDQDMVLDFEQEEDVLQFSFDSVNNTKKGTLSQSISYSHSGQNSAVLAPVDIGGSKFRFQAYHAMGSEVRNKCVSLWFYDDMNKNNRLKISLSNYSADTAKPAKPYETKNQKFSLTINSASLGNDYAYGTNSVGERSIGWHQIVWDYTSGDTCVVSLDGKQLSVEAATGFDYLTLENFWSSSDFKIYLDDFVVSSCGEKMNLKNAPTNPLTDDDKNTFGFTWVPGYEEISQYEYTTDGGMTWSVCASNPQGVGEIAAPAGTVGVRLRAADGQLAGIMLKSEVDYTISITQYYSELVELRNFSRAMFAADYQNQPEQYNSFTEALKNANEITESTESAVTEAALNNLKSAIAALTPELKPYTRYEFEEGQQENNPFIAETGHLVIGEELTAWGENLYDDYDKKHGARVDLADVDGKYSGEASYTFAKDVENKVVGIGWKAIANVTGKTTISVSNEKGDSIGLLSLPGNQTYYKVITTKDGITKTEDLIIRRLNNPHFIYWDFTNEPGKVNLYLDQRLIGTLDGMTGFNQIDLKLDDSTSEKENIIFDRLLILEKNPVTSIKFPQEKAEIGYYETYDIPMTLIDVTTKYESYPTTDKVTYTSSDSDIINVTSEGSCEPMQFGKAMITVSVSGLSDSMEVEAKDYKLTHIYITDASVADVNAIGAPGQDKNNSEPVTDTESITIDVKESQALTAVLEPKNATARLVEWVSEDPSIATVKDGLVTGVSYGTTTVTITSKDGTNLKDTIKVVVAPDTFNDEFALFVSNDGNDFTGDGSKEAPYKTLERARDEIRAICGNIPDKGAVIYFRKGIYQFTETAEFNDADSGKKNAPIVYAAYQDEDVTFIGGASFKFSEMEKVTDQDLNAGKINNAAKGNLYKINLSQLGITQLRDLQVVGHSAGGLKNAAPQAFTDLNFDKPYFSLASETEQLTLARYPNTEFVQTTKIVHGGEYSRHWMSDLIVSGTGYAYEPGMEKDTFIFTSSGLSADRLASWSQSIDVKYGAWMSGFWGAAYSDQTVPIKEINGTEITSGLISHYAVKTKSNFYVYNLLEELDIPGEWYIDQLHGAEDMSLYLYPPAGTQDDSLFMIPLLDEEMLHFDESDYITFNGINFKSTNKGVAVIDGGSHNVIRKAEIFNTISSLAKINNSENEIAKYNGFEMCNMHCTDGGIGISAGDKNTLERGYNYVENCTFTTFSTVTKTYNPAVGLSGVGNRVTNCVFTDSPHQVIQLKEPEAVMEFLECYDVIKESGDQAAIYSGRDTLNRGSVIRNCYFHDIGSITTVDNAGVYLDDGKAGVLIIDNVFENIDFGAKINGGRDNIIIGNTFKNLKYGIVTTPFCYVFANHIHNSFLGLVCDANNLASKCSVDWQDPEGPYGRFEHLSYIMEDHFAAGKYCKAVDNEFYNIKGVAKPEEINPNNYIWSKYWKILPYEEQVDMIMDWWFVKGNKYN